MLLSSDYNQRIILDPLLHNLLLFTIGGLYTLAATSFA